MLHWKKWASLWGAFEMVFRGALYIFCNILCGRNRRKVCVCWILWCSLHWQRGSTSLICRHMPGTLCAPGPGGAVACVWNPACPRTRGLVSPVSGILHVPGPGGWWGTAECMHLVLKGRVPSQSCLHNHSVRGIIGWLVGVSISLNSDVFVALECCHKWFIPRKKLWSQYY